MAKRRAIIVVAAVSLVAAMMLRLSRRTEEPTPIAAAQAAATTAPALPARPATIDKTAARSEGAAVDPQLVAHLRERYGAHIDKPYVQVKLLEKLMRYYQKRDPERWKDALLAAVRAAFPERYAEIAANLESRLAYERWVKDNQARLNQLDPEKRQEELWEERKRLFGKEAAAEIWASEIKNQEVADALKEIDGREGAKISDKLAAYNESLEDIYEEKYDSYMANHRHEVMTRFLSLSSVQAELDAMSPEERAQSLREIRKGMGLDDAAIERWDALDQKRDARWQDGKSYMAERDALAQSYTGQELEQKLAELRSRYFGTEAAIIAAEEESGFFRFSRPRHWGQN